MIINKDKLHWLSVDCENIFGSSINIDGDYSLSALLRALAHTKGKMSNVDDIEKASRITKYRCADSEDINCTFNETEFALIVGECSNDLPSEAPEGWRGLSEAPYPIDIFLSQFIKTKVFVNEAEKRVVAFVEKRANHIWVQAFESVIHKIFTWYFPKKLTKAEIELYTAVSVKERGKRTDAEMEADMQKFINFLNDTAKDLNIRDMVLHKHLDGYADKFRKSRIAQLTSTKTSLQNEILSYQRTLADRFGQLATCENEYNILIKAEPENNTEMFDFFASHKQLDFLGERPNGITFGITSVLALWDDDDFQRNLSDKYSYIWDFDNTTIRALRKIFEEKRALIKIKSIFSLNGCMVAPITRSNDGSAYGRFSVDAMPNPHIYYHGCNGGNSKYYSEYATSGDWDLGIEQAIQATMQITFSDVTVAKEMINWLNNNSNVQCIYIKDDFSPIEMEDVNESTKKISFNELKKMALKGE